MNIELRYRTVHLTEDKKQSSLELPPVASIHVFDFVAVAPTQFICTAMIELKGPARRGREFTPPSPCSTS